MTLSRTFYLIKTDFEKSLDFYGKKPTLGSLISVLLTSALIAAILYRIEHYCYKKGWLQPLARLLHLFNLILTGADMIWSAEIGERLFLGHTSGVVVSGKIGDNFTAFAAVGIGGGIDTDKDVGAGFGLPVIGNNVTCGARTLILGPLTIGDNAVIAPASFLSKSVPANGFAVGNPAKVFTQKPQIPNA